MLGTSQTLKQGRYQILSSFSQHASGALYEALDTVDNRPVMLRESVGKFGKVATPGQIEAFNAAFAGEAKVLADIKHDAVVTVHDHFSEIGRQYLVLEPVAGRSLAKYLEEGAEPPAVNDVLSWAEQLLSGLEYIHRFSPPIIHCDIRPENLTLTSDLKLKLLTTRVSSETRPNAGAKDPTEDPAFCYKPLELLWPDLGQVTQRLILNSYDETAADVLLSPVDARSDLYSAAAALYHVLTGVAPWDALERASAVLDSKPDPLKRLADLVPNVPTEVSDAFMKAMSLRREDRFDSAVIMRQVLRTAVVRAQERATVAANKPAMSIPSGNPLDIERTKFEDREREIKAEQERLDEEQKRIAARRLELEAEHQRQTAELERLKLEAAKEQQRIQAERQEREAEAERQRVAARLAELEAKREEERAEAERLEREADAERHRAEEKLQELKLKQEQHRAEQKRIELEAQKEIELAEERIKRLSLHDVKIEQISEQDLEIEQMFEQEQMFGQEEVFIPQFQEQPGFNWRMPAIIGGIAVAIAASAGGWLYFSETANAPAEQAQQIVVPAAPQPQQQVPETAPEQVQEVPVAAEQPQTPVTDHVASETVTTDEPQPGADKPIRLQTAAVIERPKKPAPEKPAAPAKKKVTVDDLINDN